ncbi:hypothetical protein HYW21_00130 [Candidatus Woesearchaeota archaeon]|nr:hypothetical protein [Candidatus Woesearchaeota archaeon]
MKLRMQHGAQTDTTILENPSQILGDPIPAEMEEHRFWAYVLQRIQRMTDSPVLHQIGLEEIIERIRAKPKKNARTSWEQEIFDALKDFGDNDLGTTQQGGLATYEFGTGIPFFSTETDSPGFNNFKESPWLAGSTYDLVFSCIPSHGYYVQPKYENGNPVSRLLRNKGKPSLIQKMMSTIPQGYGITVLDNWFGSSFSFNGSPCYETLIAEIQAESRVNALRPLVVFLESSSCPYLGDVFTNDPTLSVQTTFLRDLRRTYEGVVGDYTNLYKGYASLRDPNITTEQVKEAIEELLMSGVVMKTGDDRMQLCRLISNP